MSRAPLIAVVVVLLATSIYLFRDNRQLRDRLDRLKAAPAADTADSATRAEESAGTGERAARRSPRGFLRLSGDDDDRETPNLDAPRKETRAERRQRRQERLRAMFGREPGESIEDYRERVIPTIQTALAIPRSRIDEARRQAELAANVTDEQRRELDSVFEDVSREALALTNEAIAAGDLTPYSRNYAGVLSWSGGLGAILGSAQGRISSILGPDQLDAMSSSGFEWAEYFGLQVPWEDLDPPPPPPQ